MNLLILLYVLSIPKPGKYQLLTYSQCLLFCGSTCFGLHWIPIALQRADLREKYNLQGSCLVDLATACCCGCCDLIQQDKEAEYREAQGAGATEGYKANEGMAVPA